MTSDSPVDRHTEPDRAGFTQVGWVDDSGSAYVDDEWYPSHWPAGRYDSIPLYVKDSDLYSELPAQEQT